MNPPNHLSNDSVPSAAEETLRLIANLPAPEGLEDRVHAALQAAPRTGRILQWPASLSSGSAWVRSTAMKGAAAAAIVCVVAGGGWQVYSRVQPNKVIAMPAHVAAPGGFSNAGAMRTPQTLNGPVVKNPAAKAAHGKAAAHATPTQIRRTPNGAAQPIDASKPPAPPAN
jgi:hypothetical protein